ncbi:type II toxin-antitoxin system Phd/YefM family antitoxin [Acidipropionibacterium timonense]|uniref:type II toxin-antitoxin system Phd/YefM family antitoxin n=1 Tax=Acidipropionibacterium timonense TaxID=2161818 RepID=UPI001030E0EA|nr:type II toxin-antitoxin system prevent-host-death family antitoxin [Acidipropionibacterium timonense]
MTSVGRGEESLTQREMRNESGRVLREVAGGHSFIVTNAGIPVGRLVPLDHPVPGLQISRPSRRAGGWSELAKRRVRAGAALDEVLDELGEDRL